MDELVSLNKIYSDSWRRDPKHLGFVLARYKFVAKMLSGNHPLAEVGACDGLFSQIVSGESGYPVVCYDIAPKGTGVIKHNIMSDRLPYNYNSIYTIDVVEHVGSTHIFFVNLAASLRPHGKLIIGTPSAESQPYASELSRKDHINCMSGSQLRAAALCHFHHVFMFGMNDEVVHTGFLPMSHYLWAVCAEPRNGL